MVSVKLRIVGTYFGAKNSVTGEVTINNLRGDESVRKILGLATEAKNYPKGKFPEGVESFSFEATADNKQLGKVSVVYSKSPIKPSVERTSKKLKPGVYTLESDKDRGETGTTWQYYIYRRVKLPENLQRAEDIRESRALPKGEVEVQVNFQDKFIGFDQKKPFDVKWNEGDYTIVYRLVDIRRGPVKPK